MNFNTHITSESTIIGHKPSHSIIKFGALATHNFSETKLGQYEFEILSALTDQALTDPEVINAGFEVPSHAEIVALRQSQIKDILRKYSQDDRTNILMQAKKALNESQPLGVKAWEYLTSAVPLFGLKIPGWMIGFIAAMVAKYFSWSITLCGILFLMVQYLISVQQKNANTMSFGPIKLNELYKNRRIGSLQIPGCLIAALSAYAVLCFSGTIVNAILAGLLFWIMWSVIQAKGIKAIFNDCKTSIGIGANDDNPDNIVQKIVSLCKHKQNDLVELLKKYRTDSVDSGTTTSIPVNSNRVQNTVPAFD